MRDPILIEIAQKVRLLRREQRLTLHEVAHRAHVSKSLLSKIENGHTVPSLPVLVSIIQALDVDMKVFFEDIGLGHDMSVPYVLRRAQDYHPYPRADAPGFSYRQVLTQSLPNLTLSVYTLSLPSSQIPKPLTADGYEFHFLLKGTVAYRINDEEVTLQAGDSLLLERSASRELVQWGEATASVLVMHLRTVVEHP